MDRIIYTPPGGPPQGPGPSKDIYKFMGEGNIFRLMSIAPELQPRLSHCSCVDELGVVRRIEPVRPEYLQVAQHLPSLKP